jgi:hypothetical protein
MLQKVALILFTLVVYTVAWYGELWSAHPKYEYGAPVVASVMAASFADGTQTGEGPGLFYREGFVNAPEEGAVSHVSTLVPLAAEKARATSV